MDASVQELLDLEGQSFGESNQAGQYPAEDLALLTAARSGQLAVWSPELRESWRQDLLDAQAEGRDLISEKYERLMKPQGLSKAAWKGAGSPPSLEKLWLVDWICQAKIPWQEALVEKYLQLTHSGGVILGIPGRWKDVPFETLLRAELMGCSVNTLRLYASQVERAQKAGKNLCEAALESTLQQLGLASPEKVEAVFNQ